MKIGKSLYPWSCLKKDKQMNIGLLEYLSIGVLTIACLLLEES